MFPLLKLLIATLIATSLMTVFSYIYAEIKAGRFKEPQLLNALIRNSHIFPFHPQKASWMGWLIHYLIGAVFVILFEGILVANLIDFSFLNSVVYGLVIGCIGAAGWKLMFMLNSRPPNLRYREFYLHLIIAHGWFGVGMGLVYWMYI